MESLLCHLPEEDGHVFVADYILSFDEDELYM